MKKLLVVYSIIGAGVIAAYMPTEASKLIRQYHQADASCRGDNFNQKSTLTACSKRDALTEELLKRGFCWGSEDQAEYQKKWQLCRYFG
jgi:hypothetical protein